MASSFTPIFRIFSKRRARDRATADRLSYQRRTGWVFSEPALPVSHGPDEAHSSELVVDLVDDEMAFARSNPTPRAAEQLAPAPMAAPSSFAERQAGESERKAEPILLPVASACAVPRPDQSLGQFLTDAREQRGLTRERVAHEALLLPAYLEMMESGNYAAIPDLLYLLPFFRQYATFLGLDVEHVSARFMLEFEAQENAALGNSATARGFDWRSVLGHQSARATLVISVAALLVYFVIRVTRETAHQAAPSRPPVSLSVEELASPTAVATKTSPPMVAGPTQHPAMALKGPRKTTSRRRRAGRHRAFSARKGPADRRRRRRSGAQ